jgi:hypothetical protein
MEEERASLFDSVTSSATVSSVDAVGAQFADARPPADGSSVLPVPTSDGSTSSSVRLGEQTVRRRDSLPTLPPTDELAWMDEIDQEPDTPETSTRTRGLGWLGRKARYRASSNEEKKVVQLRPARRSSLLEALRNALGGKDNVVEPFDKEGADGGSSVASTPPRSQGMTPSRQQAEAARARATAEIERDKLFIAGKVRFVINPRAPFMGWCVRCTRPRPRSPDHPYLPPHPTKMFQVAPPIGCTQVQMGSGLSHPEPRTPPEQPPSACKLKAPCSHAGWDGPRTRLVVWCHHRVALWVWVLLT